ncbi:MAG: DnaJ domain-containing protein [Chloroflexota bacterium]
MVSDDLYSLLELHPRASTGEIDEAYRRLGRLYRSGALPALQAKDQLARIAHAYRVLSDPTARASYDATRVAASSTRGESAPESAGDPQRSPQDFGAKPARPTTVLGRPNRWWRWGGPLEASLLAVLITGFILVPAWLAVGSWLSRPGATTAVAQSAPASPKAVVPTAVPAPSPTRTAAGSNVQDARMREAVLSAVLEYDLLEEQASRALDATLLTPRATDSRVGNLAAEFEQLRQRGIRSESSFVGIQFGGVRMVARDQAEADTIEVWSNRRLDAQGRSVEETPPREIPQTILLVLERDRWKVAGVRFEAVDLGRPSGRGDVPHSDAGVEATAVAHLGAAGSLRQGGNTAGAADALSTVVALGYSSVVGDAVRLRATVHAEATSTAVSAATTRSTQATQIASSAASTAAANATSAAGEGERTRASPGRSETKKSG